MKKKTALQKATLFLTGVFFTTTVHAVSPPTYLDLTRMTEEALERPIPWNLEGNSLENDYQDGLEALESHIQDYFTPLCPTGEAVVEVTGQVRASASLQGRTREIAELLKKHSIFNFKFDSRILTDHDSPNHDPMIAQFTFTNVGCGKEVKGSIPYVDDTFSKLGDACIQSSHFNWKGALIVGGVTLATICAIHYGAAILQNNPNNSNSPHNNDTQYDPGTGEGIFTSAAKSLASEISKKGSEVVIKGAIAGSLVGAYKITQMVFQPDDDPVLVFQDLEENIRLHLKFCCKDSVVARKGRATCDGFSRLLKDTGEKSDQIRAYADKHRSLGSKLLGLHKVDREALKAFIEDANALNKRNKTLFRKCTRENF